MCSLSGSVNLSHIVVDSFLSFSFLYLFILDFPL